MAHPRATIRPRRSKQAQASASLLSKITLVCCVLLAIVCFLPVGSQVRAAEQKDNDYGTVIGIDLGTTYSCVA